MSDCCPLQYIVVKTRSLIPKPHLHIIQAVEQQKIRTLFFTSRSLTSSKTMIASSKTMITSSTEDYTRLQQEVTSLQQENIHLKQDSASQIQIHQQEVTHHQQTISQLEKDNVHLKQNHQQKIIRLKHYHQQEITCLQEEARQLQSRLDQQPKLGSDTDISFWVVSHNEVRPTGQVLGEGGWGRVVVGSFRGQDVAMKQLHSIISSSDYTIEISSVARSA